VNTKHCVSHTQGYKVKKVKNCQIEKGSNQTFSAVCHHQGGDGKQPKTFGLNLF